MGKKRNKVISSGTTAAIGAVWLAYDRYTTVSGLPEDVMAFAKALADPPWYLPWAILVTSVIIFAWSLWEKDEQEEEISTQSSSTTGDGSHSVIAPNGVVHIYSPTPPSVGMSYGLTNESADGLLRAVSIPSGSNDLTKPYTPPLPDIAMVGFLGRVYRKCGKVPEDGRLKATYYKRVDREIQDAVVLNKLSTWGYYGDTAIRPIGSHIWQNAVLDHRKKTLSITTDGAWPMVMKDLRFNKEEVDAIWPE